MIRFHILTLFPEAFQGPFDVSILNRAQEQGLVEVHFYNIREFTHDRHHTVDDYPFGGGGGMLMKPEPLFEAVEAVRQGILQDGKEGEASEVPTILLSPQGKLFCQAMAERWAQEKDLILVCGRYEGVDERVREHLVTEEVSIGDYVLGGGELPAMVLVEAIARLVPGVLGSAESLEEESHASGLLEYPQYTRPREFRGWEVPEVLLSGDHQRIARWRREQALLGTRRRRPDLLARAQLTPEDKEVLERLSASQEPPEGEAPAHA
jgi:tRNA (guanine37-N1)-methyltransferase